MGWLAIVGVGPSTRFPPFTPAFLLCRSIGSTPYTNFSLRSTQRSKCICKSCEERQTPSEILYHSQQQCLKLLLRSIINWRNSSFPPQNNLGKPIAVLLVTGNTCRTSSSCYGKCNLLHSKSICYIRDLVIQLDYISTCFLLPWFRSARSSPVLSTYSDMERSELIETTSSDYERRAQIKIINKHKIIFLLHPRERISRC